MLTGEPVRPTGGAAPRVTLLVTLALALLLAAAIGSFASVRQLRLDAARVAHSHQVEGGLNALLAQLTEVESTQRGFLLLGDSAMLREYRRTAPSVTGTLRAVRTLVADSPAQAARLDSAAPLVRERLALLDERLRIEANRDTVSLLVARQLLAAGAARMTHIEALVDAMRAEERARLAERAHAVTLSARLAAGALVVGALVSLLLTVAGFRVLRRELRERLHAEDGLRESEARFRRLADASPDAIAIMVDGRVVDVNAAFVRLFGHDVATLRGTVPTDLIAPAQRAAAQARTDANVEGEYESVGLRRDGSTFPMSVSSRRANYAGQPARVSVVRDLGERQEIDRMKKEFVSVVSHELRTPLTSIRGSLGLVEGGVAGVLPPKAQELVRIARANSERLIRLINDILDVEKIESGKLELRLATVDLRELVEASLEGVQGMAQQAGVRLRAQVARDGRVHGDRDRLVQVVTNLLSNAIKFSAADDEVLVTVDGADDGRVAVTVEDHGPGILPEHLPRLFQKFTQLDASDRRSQGGTGLGLAISRAIVEQHGGALDVRSEPGVRTRFTFTLPRLHELQAAPPRAADDERPRLLVVEDDPDVVATLAALLGASGYALTHAPTAEAALALARRQPFAALLLDIGLPDGDGLEFVGRLRREEPTIELPVVVVSGREPDGTFQSPLLVDWIPKPFEAERVQRALHRALRRPGPARVLVVDDDAGTRTVVTARLRTLGLEVFEAADGVEALGRCRALAPDLLVLDVSMPRMDGFEVVSLLRAHGRPAPPLIVYSGRELNAAERRSLTLGVTRHLTKARATEERFVASVRELLGGIAA